MIINYNGYHLESIGAHGARQLPDGSVLIYVRYWVDNSYHTTKREFYRVTVESRKTVGGMVKAVRWTPDADFPQMPGWQGDWVWIDDSFGHSYMQIMSDDEYHEKSMRGIKVINVD